MPILSAETREKILQKGRLVYTAYAALNLATDSRVAVKFQNMNFNEYLNDLIASGQTGADLVVDGVVYKIHLIDADAEYYKVVITDEDGNPPPAVTPKALDDYTPADALALWANHSVLVNKINPLKLALEFSSDATTQRIGGDKIDLYAIHIRNLYRLLQNLNDPQRPPHALIEMATGSGKSFTQALWWMVLHLAQVPAVFAVPTPPLAGALRSEFRRLLPDSIADAADITSHADLLSSRWQALRDQPGELFVVIDEQHEAMRKELFSRRLRELRTRQPLLFLTATPSLSAYEIVSDPEAVLELSRAKKESLGLAQRAKNISSKARRLLDRVTTTWKQKLLLAIVETLEPERTSAAHNYVEEVERTFSLRDGADFHVKKAEIKLTDEDGLRHYVRWNLESPIGERALVHATSHDAVVNMTILAGKKDREEIEGARGRRSTLMREDAYRKGNRVPRKDVYLTLQMSENPDEIHREEYAKRHQDQRQKTVTDLLRADLGLAEGSRELNAMQEAIQQNVDFSCHHDYLDYRIQHGLLENALEYLTGYDSVKLDRMRRDNLTGLVAGVRDNLAMWHLTTVEDVATRLVPELMRWLSDQGLNRHPPLTNQVATLIATMIFLMAKETDPRMLARMVDNWQLDKILHDGVFAKLPIKLAEAGAAGEPARVLCDQLADYLEKHRMVYVMGNLEHAETPIQAGKPFYELKAATTPLKPAATKRKLGIFEQMDPYLHQFSYQPLSLIREQKQEIKGAAPGLIREQKQEIKDAPAEPGQYDEVETVDCLFRLGLVGCYVTSEKTVGFNDPHLQHVGILVDSNDDFLNQPDVMIQAAGRNRGLNPARRPYCITSTDYGVTLTFEPRDLEQAGARRAYWKAKKAYHQQLIDSLKIRLSEEIQLFIEQNIDAEGELDEGLLQEKCIPILLKGFDRLYVDNEHDFAQTRTEFIALLKGMQAQIIQKTQAIRKTYQTPIFVKIIGTLSDLLAKIQLYFKTKSSRAELVAALKAPGSNPSSADKTYAHIIASYSYKRVALTQSVGLKLAKMMGDKAKALVFKAAAASARYLKAGVENPFDDNFRFKIAPILLQHVIKPEHRAALQAMINRKPWLGAAAKFWLENKERLEQLRNSQDPTVFFNVVFKPLLLQDAEIAAYVEENQVVFDENLLKDKAEHLQQTVEEVNREAKQLAAGMDQIRTEFSSFHVRQREETESRLEAIAKQGKEEFQRVAEHYVAEAEAMPAKVMGVLEEFSRRFDSSRQKGFASKAIAVLNGAVLAVSSRNAALNDVFKQRILHDCLCPLLDRESNEVMQRVLADPGYDWSINLLKHWKDARFKAKSAMEKLEILVEATLTKKKDRTDVLGILNKLKPQESKEAGAEPPGARESKGSSAELQRERESKEASAELPGARGSKGSGAELQRERESKEAGAELSEARESKGGGAEPLVAKAAIFERMEMHLRTVLLPQVLDALFDDEDKALLLGVVRPDYFLTNPANRDLVEKARKQWKDSLSPQEKLNFGRKFLTAFFLNLISDQEDALRTRVTAIISKVPFSKLYPVVNQKLKETIFVYFASIMNTAADRASFNRITSRYDTWGRHCIDYLHENSTALADPEKFINTLIEKVVSNPAEQAELLALMAAINPQRKKKEFIIQGITLVKEDILASLPDHSPVKQAYTAQAPAVDALRAGLARVFESTGNVAEVLESKTSELSKLDFIAELLGRALHYLPGSEAKQPADGARPVVEAKQPADGARPVVEAKQPADGARPVVEAKQPADGAHPLVEAKQPADEVHPLAEAKQPAGRTHPLHEAKHPAEEAHLPGEAKQLAAAQPATPFQDLERAIRENRAFAESLPSKLDKGKLKALLIKRFQPIFGDAVYKKTINDILGPLDKDHIETILNALYPGQNNRQNATLLVAYKDDLLRMPPDRLLDTYLNLDDQDGDLMAQLQDSHLFRISALTIAILEEVQDCLSYFHNADSARVPRLQGVGTTAAVWSARTPSSQIVRNCLQIRQMKAFVETYTGMNAIEVLQTRDETRHSLQAAAALGRLSQDLSQRGAVASQGHFALFAQAMRQAEGLTSAEVLDAKTEQMSAVDKLKQAVRPSRSS